jgi:tetratricopeptide (TPR) repeat protein
MSARPKSPCRASILAAFLAAGGIAATPLPVLAQDGSRLALDAARQQAQGNLEQALATLTEALNDGRLTNDRRAVILTDRGALYARLNQPKAAIEDFNRAVQLYPEFPAIYNNRGSTLLTLGLAREAIKDFDRAIVLAPGYVAAYNNRASARLLLGQHDAAITDFTRAVELSPQTVAALTGRGRAQLAAQRPQGAQRDFTHALALDNRFALAYRLRAEARLASDRVTEAVEDLSRATAFEPTNAEIYIERGHAYMHAENVAAALKDYSRAVELDGQSVAALEARALAYIKVDAQNEAEADIARALELSPRASAAMAARAQLYLNTGQPDLSQREIERAMKLAPTRAEVLMVKGNIEVAAGRREGAIASYRAALAAKPSLREASAALARLGRFDARGETVEISGQGFEHWRIVRRGVQHFAVSDLHPRLAVPLEGAADPPPRLVGYETGKAPNAHIAILRFSPGRAPGGTVTDEVVHAVVVDLQQSAVLGTLPDRNGPRQASWSWEEGRLVVTAADGLADEFPLRGGPRGAAVAAAPGPRRSVAEGPRTYAPPTWLPFGAQPAPQRRAQRSQPKTLFQLLFGN